MSRYDGRLSRLHKKIPRKPMGDFEIWLENGDGTLTGPNGKIITEAEYDALPGPNIVLGDEENNSKEFMRWQAGEYDEV